MIEQVKRAFQIKDSGSYSKIDALKCGMRGETYLVPHNEETAEAYRTGLSIFYGKLGFNVPFEKVIKAGNEPLQEGFFAMFNVFLSENHSQNCNLRENFETRLKISTYFAKTEKKKESFYISYVNGAIIALDVMQEYMERKIQKAIEEEKNTSEERKRFYYEANFKYFERIRKDKQDLFERLENPTTYEPLLKDFDLDQREKLAFLREQRRTGRLQKEK